MSEGRGGRGGEDSDVREGRTVMYRRRGENEWERMTVDSNINFRLRVKYIGAARMIELQGIKVYSFIPNLDR